MASFPGRAGAAAAAGGPPAEPAADRDGHAVEPVGVDHLRAERAAEPAPRGYPGTDTPVRQQVAVIEACGPLLHRASPRTKILAYDHNWSTRPDGRRSAGPRSTAATTSATTPAAGSCRPATTAPAGGRSRPGPAPASSPPSTSPAPGPGTCDHLDRERRQLVERRGRPPLRLTGGQDPDRAGCRSSGRRRRPPPRRCESRGSPAARRVTGSRQHRPRRAGRGGAGPPCCGPGRAGGGPGAERPGPARRSRPRPS